MKKCKNCQTEIDEKATKCPHCQSDQRIWLLKHPILTAILSLFVLGIIGSAVDGSKGSKSSPMNTFSGNSNPTVQINPTATPMPEVIKIADSDAWIQEYNNNKFAANDKYAGKYLEFTARIQSIGDRGGKPYLDLHPTTGDYFLSPIICDFNSTDQVKLLTKDQVVTLRGKAEASQDFLGSLSVTLKGCSVVQ